MKFFPESHRFGLYLSVLFPFWLVSNIITLLSSYVTDILSPLLFIYILCYITNLSTILNFCNFTGCKCNKLGSLNGMCDSRRYCFCKPQYIGKRCDQCKAGFGNFPKCTGFYTLVIFRIFFCWHFSCCFCNALVELRYEIVPKKLQSVR